MCWKECTFGVFSPECGTKINVLWNMRSLELMILLWYWTLSYIAWKWPSTLQGEPHASAVWNKHLSWCSRPFFLSFVAQLQLCPPPTPRLVFQSAGLSRRASESLSVQTKIFFSPLRSKLTSVWDFWVMSLTKASNMSQLFHFSHP